MILTIIRPLKLIYVTKTYAYGVSRKLLVLLVLVNTVLPNTKC